MASTATVATAPSSATLGTSLVLSSGQGALFPATPFTCLVYPAGATPTSSNTEIIRVVARNGDTFSTISRAQDGSSGRAIGVGDSVTLAVTDTVDLWALETFGNGGSMPDIVAPVATGVEATDTANLQTFLTAWGAVGGRALIPSNNTYKVNTPLAATLAAPGVLICNDTTIKVGASFPVGSNAVLSIAGNDWKLYGLNIHGNDLANRIFTIKATSKRVLVADCEFQHGAQQVAETDLNCVGIRIEGGCDSITIDRTYIHNIVAGANNLASLARGIEISDPFANGDTTNVKVTNSTFTDITYTGTTSTDADGIRIGDTTGYSGLLVQGCYFTRIYKRAVKIQSPGATVEGCTYVNSYLGTSGVNIANTTDPQVFAGISVYANDCVIANNKLLGGSWFQGLEIGTSATTVNRVTLIGNRVIGGTTATMTGSAGIRVYGANTAGDFTIADNYVKRFSKGIWLSTAAVGVTITGNQIQGDSVASSTGVFCDGQSGVYPTRVTANSNSIEGVARYGFELAGGTDWTITGNMAGRGGFEVIQPVAYTNVTRLYAWNNSGSSTTAIDDRARRDRGDLGTFGEGILAEAFSRLLINAQVAPATQQVYAMRLGLRAGDTVTNILAILTTLAVGTTPTLIKLALLDKTGKVLGVSADTSASAIWTSALGPKSVPLASPVSITADDVYYAAFLRNGVFGTTDMQIGRVAGQTGNQVQAFGSGVNSFGAQATQTDFQAVNASQTLTIIGTSYPWLGVN